MATTHYFQRGIVFLFGKPCAQILVYDYLRLFERANHRKYVRYNADVGAGSAELYHLGLLANCLNANIQTRSSGKGWFVNYGNSRLFIVFCGFKDFTVDTPAICLCYTVGDGKMFTFSGVEIILVVGISRKDD